MFLLWRKYESIQCQPDLDWQLNLFLTRQKELPFWSFLLFFRHLGICFLLHRWKTWDIQVPPTSWNFLNTAKSFKLQNQMLLSLHLLSLFNISISIYSILYLLFNIYKTLTRCRSPAPSLHLLLLFSFLLAPTTIAISRTADYHHHWQVVTIICQNIAIFAKYPEHIVLAWKDMAALPQRIGQKNLKFVNLSDANAYIITDIAMVVFNRVSNCPSRFNDNWFNHYHCNRHHHEFLKDVLVGSLIGLGTAWVVYRQVDIQNRSLLSPSSSLPYHHHLHTVVGNLTSNYPALPSSLKPSVFEAANLNISGSQHHQLWSVAGST